MKKKLLLALGLTAGLFLTACGEGDTSESETVDTTDTVYVTGIDIVDLYTGESIDTLSISTTDPGDIEVVVTPTNATVQTVTWTVSEEGILDLTNIAYGAIGGLASGTVTLTATADGAAEGETVSDSITVVVSEYTEMAIGDFADNAEGGSLYYFEGILEDLDHTDQYGNCYITDPTTGDTVYCYGATTESTALSGSGSSWTFTNPRTAPTTLADYENGEWVTGIGVWSSTYSNLSVVFWSHEEADYTYSVTLSDSIVNGTAEIVGETSGYAYGDTVTIAVTPDEGYVANSVTITTAYGIEVATASGNNTFTFGAYCVNTVSASFIITDGSAISIDLYETSGNLAGFGLGTSYSNGTNTLQGVELTATYCCVNNTSYDNWPDALLTVADRYDRHDDGSYDIPDEGGSLLIYGGDTYFTSIDLSYYWYAATDTTLTIAYSNDGDNWTSLFSEAQPSSVDYGEQQNYSSAETEFLANYIRISVLKEGSTNSSYNRRVGLYNVTLGLPTAD